MSKFIGIYMKLGERLDRCMKMLGINQRELAELCGWKPARISHYINNRRPLSLKDIELLAKILHCNPAWLAYGAGMPPQYLKRFIPNKETIKAMKAARRGEVEAVGSVDDLIELFGL